jgi:hypothetical protein
VTRVNCDFAAEAHLCLPYLARRCARKPRRISDAPPRRMCRFAGREIEDTSRIRSAEFSTLHHCLKTGIEARIKERKRDREGESYLAKRFRERNPLKMIRARKYSLARETYEKSLKNRFQRAGCQAAINGNASCASHRDSWLFCRIRKHEREREKERTLLPLYRRRSISDLSRRS